MYPMPHPPEPPSLSKMMAGLCYEGSTKPCLICGRVHPNKFCCDNCWEMASKEDKEMISRGIIPSRLNRFKVKEEQITKEEKQTMKNQINKVKSFFKRNPVLTQLTIFISCISFLALLLDNYANLKGQLTEAVSKAKNSDGVKEFISDIKKISQPYKAKIDDITAKVQEEATNA